jgi:hypothetical protein
MVGLERSPTASSVVRYQLARYPAAMTQNINTSLAHVCAAAALAWATAIAPVVTISLLAASGFDPLGVVVTGLAQGQRALNPVGGQPAGPPITPKPGGPLTPSTTTYKVDAIEFVLKPEQFVEYKFNLKTGATMMFNWKASAPVDVDFHTVPDGKPISASETFMRGKVSGGQGFYRAPYPGLHGWYWLNSGKEEVKIILNASGFFNEARMFSGDPEGEPMEVKDPPPPE